MKHSGQESPSLSELARARGLFALEERRRRGWPSEDFDVAALAAAVNNRTGLSYTYEAARGWIRGALPKDRETRLAVASELGVDQNWLYHGEGTPPPGFDDALPRILAVIREQASGRPALTSPYELQQKSPSAPKAKRRPKRG